MTRIALLSDVHGNLPALDAVLGDIVACGVDATYCLGDLVGYGPDPAGVVERVRSAAIPTVRGNYDDGIGRRRGDCGCYYATPQARADGEASFTFTDEALGEADHDWLATLPDHIRLEIEGRRVLLAHGSPRKINEYLLPDREERLLIRLAEDAGADIVCVGHVHLAYHRTMHGTDGGRIDYVSAGSAGRPKDGDTRACWVELVITDCDVHSVVHRVGYDVEAVAAATTEAGLPSTLADALRLGR